MRCYLTCDARHVSFWLRRPHWESTEDPADAGTCGAGYWAAPEDWPRPWPLMRGEVAEPEESDPLFAAYPVLRYGDERSIVEIEMVEALAAAKEKA